MKHEAGKNREVNREQGTKNREEKQNKWREEQGTQPAEITFLRCTQIVHFRIGGKIRRNLKLDALFKKLEDNRRIVYKLHLDYMPSDRLPETVSKYTPKIQTDVGRQRRRWIPEPRLNPGWIKKIKCWMKTPWIRDIMERTLVWYEWRKNVCFLYKQKVKEA